MTDTPFIKAFIIAVFVLILVALGSAARSLFRRGDENSTATVKALTVRVALSFALIITLGVLYALGVIEPNG